MSGSFEPRLRRLQVVAPRRVGSSGGPTRGQAYGPGWRRTGPGLFVPSTVAWSVEQRVVESVTPVPPGGLLTGWAGLRLAGGAYFEGAGRPVAVVVPRSTHPRPRTGLRWVRREVDPGSRGARVGHLTLISPPEALLDHVVDEVTTGRFREAVVAVDMAMAAGLATPGGVLAAAAARPRVARRSEVVRVLDLARPGSASPPESRLRLLWALDAELPEPVLNTWVHDADGRAIAVPDLLDPASGLLVEYDGEDHAGVRRRTRDAQKDDLYRELGLEPVRVTALDMRARGLVVDRLARAHRRALASSRPRRWVLGDRFDGASVRSVRSRA